MSEFDIEKIRRLEGSLLLIFDSLVELRNAKETAARLGLSPSAVSHALSRLRELFGDALFVRRPHGLEPTARAIRLRPRVEELLSRAEALLETRRDFDPARTSRLFGVAAPEHLTAQIAGPLVKRWKGNAPALFVHYRHLPPLDALREVRRGELDLAIGRFEEDIPPGLVKERLYEDSFCVVARRGHPRIRGSVSQSQYESEAHALAAAPSEVTVEERATYPKTRSGAIVDGWTTALTIAAETDALVTCHRRLAERLEKLLKLQVLDPPFRPYVFTVSVVRRDDHDRGVAWIVERIREAVAGG